MVEGYTNDETGRAFGKTLYYKKYDDIGNIIFLDKEIMVALISESPMVAVHLINHELCHVNDNFMKYKMLGMEFSFRDIGNLNITLKIHANVIWAEYIATKLAVSTTNDGNDWNINFLFDLIKINRANCDDAIQMYKKDNDAVSLYGKVQLNSSSVLKAACTVYGYLHGMKLLNEQLKGMSKSYRNWEDESEIAKLGNVVLKTWNKMGM